MREYVAKRNPNICPIHPGAILRDSVLPALGRPKTEIARLLDISRQHLYDILDEKKPITPEMAVKIGKLCGNGAGIWARLQLAYDTWHAERSVDVKHIPTLKAKAA